MAKPKIGKYHTTYLFMAAAQRYTKLLEARAKIEDNITSLEPNHDDVEYQGNKPSGDLSRRGRHETSSNLLFKNLPR